MASGKKIANSTMQEPSTQEQLAGERVAHDPGVAGEQPRASTRSRA
ncbi:MAG: hypothetical protein WDM88_12825 [Galbitalea sp.]